MTGIPRIAHFVFGLRAQTEPFHPLHYAALESCRRVVQPDRILLHYHWLPFGTLWDRIRPHLELVRVDRVGEVDNTNYDERLVPEAYRYAHHADFIRLDALIAYGGLYADIDTVFLRPIPVPLWQERFVIGREPSVADERTGESKPSLCNAFMMGEPGSVYATAWRNRITNALNGTWSNHSGFLAQQLSEELPETVCVQPESAFFPVPSTPPGLESLFAETPIDLGNAISLHLWEHLWWQPERTDFSTHHADEFTLTRIHRSKMALARLVQPFLPTPLELSPENP